MSAERINGILNMLEREPDDVFLNYALALEYLKQPESGERALRQLQKVIALDPSYLAAYYQLGKFFEAANDAEGALNYYRKGLELAEIKKDRKAAGEFREAVFLLED